MTAQYNGNDFYTIRLDNECIVLHMSDIKEIQEFDFETGKPTASVETMKAALNASEATAKSYKESLLIAKDTILALDSEIDRLENHIKLLMEKLD